PDQLRKPVRHSLSDHVVVHGAELMPDPRLNLGVQPALLLYFLHGLIHASPRVNSLYFQELTSKIGPWCRVIGQRLMRIAAEGSEILELFLELFCPIGVIRDDRGTGPPPKLNLTPEAVLRLRPPG